MEFFIDKLARRIRATALYLSNPSSRAPRREALVRIGKVVGAAFGALLPLMATERTASAAPGNCGRCSRGYVVSRRYCEGVRSTLGTNYRSCTDYRCRGGNRCATVCKYVCGDAFGGRRCCGFDDQYCYNRVGECNA